MLAVVQMRYVMRFGVHRGWGRTGRRQALGLVAAHNRCSPYFQCFDAIYRLLGPCRPCRPGGLPSRAPRAAQDRDVGMALDGTHDHAFGLFFIGPLYYSICSDVQRRQAIVRYKRLSEAYLLLVD
jgi:hypothetical protein